MEVYGHFMTTYGIMPDQIDNQSMELFFDVKEGLEKKQQNEKYGKTVFVDEIEP